MAKIKIESIKEEAQELGWTLISESYKNLDQDLEWNCSEGHLVIASLKKWRKKPQCTICEKNESLAKISEKVKKDKGVKRVLAIDDATNVTGWAIFDNKVLKSYGHFTAKSADPIERIVQVKQWLLSMILKWNPDRVALEDIQLQKFFSNGKWDYNVTIYKVLAHLQGVLLTTLFENKVENTVVHATQWKSFAGISAKNRTDQKRAAQEKVNVWYDMKVTQDEADAICIGKYVIEKYLKNTEMISFE